MKLTEIMTLQEVSEKYNIPLKTLQYRLDSLKLIEGEDCRRLGKRMPTLLSPQGVRKILKLEVDE